RSPCRSKPQRRLNRISWQPSERRPILSVMDDGAPSTPGKAIAPPRASGGHGASFVVAAAVAVTLSGCAATTGPIRGTLRLPPGGPAAAPTRGESGAPISERAADAVIYIEDAPTPILTGKNGEAHAMKPAASNAVRTRTSTLPSAPARATVARH